MWLETTHLGTPHLSKDRSLALTVASPFSYSRCLEFMLNHVSHHGPMCHLIVASHNEESVQQATKWYEVGYLELGTHKKKSPSFLSFAHVPGMGRG